MWILSKSSFTFNIFRVSKNCSFQHSLCRKKTKRFNGPKKHTCRIYFHRSFRKFRGSHEQSILPSIMKKHTNIISHHNPSVRINDPVYHTIYVVCVNFIHKSGTYSLKSIPNARFFEKRFMAIFIYSQSFCNKSAERKSP